MTETPDKDHNQDHDQHKAAFLQGFLELRQLKEDAASVAGEASQFFKRMKRYGFTKADFAWAAELNEKNAAEIVETMERRLRIARWFRHEVVAQIDMFEGPDRTPAADRAFNAGYSAAVTRADTRNPHDESTEQGQAWARGYSDGTALINQQLADELDDDESHGDE